jgi:hypothetical protein
LLKIKVDANPFDVKWHIQKGDDVQNVVAIQNSAGYKSPYRTYFEEITTLQPNTQYTLVFYDICPGGMNGYVTIFLGTEEEDNNVLAFVDLYDKSSFDKLTIPFITSVNATGSLPSATPSHSPSLKPSMPSVSPFPTYIPTLIMVRFRTYVDSRTTGWYIASSLGTIVHNETPGFFRGNEPVFLRSLEVNQGETYRLVITDSTGLGFSGEASVYLGNLLDDSTLIAFYDGSIGKKFYQYAINFTTSLDARVVPFHTASPSLLVTSQVPIGYQVKVLIMLRTGSSPMETALKLTTLNGSVISQVLFGTYQKQFFSYGSIANLNDNQTYVMTVLDKVGGGIQSNVSIYRGTKIQPSMLLATWNKPEDMVSEKKLIFRVSIPNYPSFAPSNHNTSETNVVFATNHPSPASLINSEQSGEEDDDSEYWDRMNANTTQDSSFRCQYSIFSFLSATIGYFLPVSITILFTV